MFRLATEPVDQISRNIFLTGKADTKKKELFKIHERTMERLPGEKESRERKKRKKETRKLNYSDCSGTG